MRSADHLDWLKIALTPGIGPSLFFQLIQVFDQPQTVLGASEKDLKQIPKLKGEALGELRKTQSGARDDSARKEIDQIQSRGIRILTLKDSLYPLRLLHIPTPPPLLFYRGNIKQGDQHHFAIVGTRRCDSYGLRQARSFAGEIASAGLIIVSGLALGIDTAAHQGALTVGGNTWAFLPGGFGHLYPPENLSLAEEIAEKGVLITERTLDSQPLRNSFPARNRLVSGVSAGVLVIQAPPKSGALITATLAMEQGRDVYALPGRVDDAASLGPHRLIRDGARLAMSPSEILAELNLRLDGVSPLPDPIVKKVTPPRTRSVDPPGQKATSKRKEVSNLTTLLSDPVDKKIVLRLEQGPVHIDRISGDLDVPVKTVSERLLLLEMQGVVKRLPGMSFDLTS